MFVPLNEKINTLDAGVSPIFTTFQDSIKKKLFEIIA
jgi:hypothetical protein